jgi:hypothetical protein
MLLFNKLTNIEVAGMKINSQKGITILALIIWVLIIGLAIIYAPKAYQYVLNANIKRIVTSNVQSVEAEIRSELISKHPVLIWNNIDELIKRLNFQNPIMLEQQIKNGWDRPGDVVVTFDGINTFRLDGIGRDGSSLRLNIIIQKAP